jgi:hypothetical protein
LDEDSPIHRFKASALRALTEARGQMDSPKGQESAGGPWNSMQLGKWSRINEVARCEEYFDVIIESATVSKFPLFYSARKISPKSDSVVSRCAT